MNTSLVLVVLITVNIIKHVFIIDKEQSKGKNVIFILSMRKLALIEIYELLRFNSSCLFTELQFNLVSQIIAILKS